MCYKTYEIIENSNEHLQHSAQLTFWICFAKPILDLEAKQFKCNKPHFKHWQYVCDLFSNHCNDKCQNFLFLTYSSLMSYKHRKTGLSVIGYMCR